MAKRRIGIVSCHLEPKDIVTKIRSHQDEIDACRRAFQRRRPGASGMARVRFLITPAGDVPGACGYGDRSLDDEALRCVAAVIAFRTFTNPPLVDCGANSVDYPIHFGP